MTGLTVWEDVFTGMKDGNKKPFNIKQNFSSLQSKITLENMILDYWLILYFIGWDVCIEKGKIGRF